MLWRLDNAMKLNILLICNEPKTKQDASTILDHISSFKKYSRHNICTYSNIGNFSADLDLNNFDAIIVHYTIYLMNDFYLSIEAKKQLSQYTGLKILFVQDEYRRINQLISEINKIKFDVYFTCFPEAEITKVYPKELLPNVSLYSNLTGYFPENLLNISHNKIKDRKIDVIYRSRKVPYWLGQLGYEKWSIVEQWHQHTQGMNLTVDLSYQEQDRIYGEKWIEFLSSAKTTLGVESGASVLDFTGKLQLLVDFHQQTFPEDSFHEIQQMYFIQHEGKYKLNQISPRCFEAIALKTVLILLEGEYSGILIPNRHYIELKKDFSNINEVVSLIKDNDFLENMADLAYKEIALNDKYSYKSFIKKVDDIIDFEFSDRNKIQLSESITNPLALEEQILIVLLKKNRMEKSFSQIKFFITHKVKVFNPLLTMVKRHKNRLVNAVTRIFIRQQKM